MNYPYPKLLSQLQFLCDVGEYRRVTDPARYKPYRPNLEYWSIIPDYLYAYCPFCGQGYREKANTYEIKHWGYEGLASNLYALEPQQAIETKRHCHHFMGVRSFINFHGVEPYEVDRFANSEGEVPFVEDQFFATGIRIQSVLHALPICRIEENKFVPRYTVFLMTYFSENPSQVKQHIYDNQAVWLEIDPEYWPVLVRKPTSEDKDRYYLDQWAIRGQLGWLDFTIPSLPLRIGQGEQLPELCRTIQGRRNAYVWTKPLQKK